MYIWGFTGLATWGRRKRVPITVESKAWCPQALPDPKSPKP